MPSDFLKAITVLTLTGFGVHANGQDSGPGVPADHQSLIKRYCVTCHNESLNTANLHLESFELGRLATNVAGADEKTLWEKVLHKLRSGAMPPGDFPQPPAAERQALIAWLTRSLDAAAAAAPNPGRPAAHRLNRTEYVNAIRDLLALEIDADSLFPSDGSEFGFDNNADALTTSPMLLERYLAAAARISRLAIGDPATRPSIQSYDVSKLLSQDDRMSEQLPFGSRGGTIVRHHFPLDAEYVIKVRLSGRPREDLEVRVDGQRVALIPATARAAPDQEIRFRAMAGTRPVALSFVRQRLAPEGVAPRKFPIAGVFGLVSGVAGFEIAGPYDATGIGADSASRQRVFASYPEGPDDEMASAREILTTLARRAFRRPVTDDDIDPLLPFFSAGRREGGFERGIQRALELILVDPEFLFRIEADPNIPPKTAHALGDLELASRLSFFLWSSIPDDELLEVAERGGLSDAAERNAQVRRMLADPKAETLVTNFAAQWLHLRNMRAVAPDPNVFPGFDDNLRADLQRETELLLLSQFAEDRGIGDLLDADYTFLNERLAHHYGIPGVRGNRFRRVSLTDQNRFGLLGQGSFLTVTSYATRTSPVVRGKWVLDNVLGSPPPAPPPDVPSLPEASEAGFAATTVRERMEQHRKDPVCASCHVTMDPIGFALENFDGIGRWRTTGSDGLPLDATGTLPNGTTFQGPAGLRGHLLSQKEEFVRNAVQKLLTYAIGRGIEYYDQPAIRQILRDAQADNYSWSSVILGVTQSLPFLMRRSSS